MSEHRVAITGPHYSWPHRYDAECSCGWQKSVPTAVTAAVVWNQHVKGAV